MATEGLSGSNGSTRPNSDLDVSGCHADLHSNCLAHHLLWTAIHLCRATYPDQGHF